MTDWYKLYETLIIGMSLSELKEVEVNNNLNSIILIILIISFMIFVIAIGHKKEGLAFLMFLILVLIPQFYFFKIHIPQSEKRRQNRELNLISSYSPKLKTIKDVQKFVENYDKMYDFCKTYYSIKDKDFCHDNSVNKYTMNIVFENIYGKHGMMTDDVKQALEYINNGKSEN